MKFQNLGFPSPKYWTTPCLDTFSLIHYLIRVHPSLKQLLFFSVSPEALLLQPSEWDQASQYHVSPTQTHLHGSWPDETNPPLTHCFVSHISERLSLGLGVVLLSKISGQNLHLSVIRSPMTSSNSQFFFLIYLEWETSLLLCIEKCTWPAMCCWAWGERRGNEWIAPYLPITICYNNMQGYFTLKQVSPTIKQTNQPTTHCSSCSSLFTPVPTSLQTLQIPCVQLSLTCVWSPRTLSCCACN